MPLYTVALINPHGRITGVGKATLQMKAKDRPVAVYEALRYARENYNWGYHLKDALPPRDEAYAKAELRMMRENAGLPKLDPEPALAAVPEGVTVPTAPDREKPDRHLCG